MKNSKLYAIAIILGSISVFLIMISHPTGADIQPDNANALHSIQVAIWVHALAIASIPMAFFGFLGLSRILGIEKLSVQAALIAYGFSGIAGMCAAVFSGFGATSLAKMMLKTNDEAARQVLKIIYQYNGFLNQGFAKIIVVASSIAMILWAGSFWKLDKFAKFIGISGLLIGSVSLTAFFAGYLRVNVLGFGIFVFAQSFWAILTAVWMFKNETTEIEKK